MTEIFYKMDLEGVDWGEMKATLHQDHFDNGRSPEQLKVSFENSYAACIAMAENHIIGTVRVLSDGVCNAYIVDVWTLSGFRHRGIASMMVKRILARLDGQHVYLFTDDAKAFYASLGFEEQGIGMGKVMGDWLGGKKY